MGALPAAPFAGIDGLAGERDIAIDMQAGRIEHGALLPADHKADDLRVLVDLDARRIGARADRGAPARARWWRRERRSQPRVRPSGWMKKGGRAGIENAKGNFALSWPPARPRFRLRQAGRKPMIAHERREKLCVWLLQSSL